MGVEASADPKPLEFEERLVAGPEALDRREGEALDCKEGEAGDGGEGGSPAPVMPQVRRDTPAMRAAALLLVIAISAGILAFRSHLAALAAYGYAGLFVIGAIGSATVFLPMPGLALAFASGSTFAPLLVGLAFGSGAAFGELTGYLAGFSGRGVVENRAFYGRVVGWMQRYGLWVIFAMSLIPNPLADVAGLTAGALRIPMWRFLAATWAGNVLKATVVALAGAGAINLLAPLIRAWLQG